MCIRDRLKGLSKNELSNLKKHEEKFIITMAYPDVNAVSENCNVRSTREKVWKSFNNRAVKDNIPILKEAVLLRNEKSKLFGFETWAEYRLQNRMAKNPKNVDSMYRDLIPKLQNLLREKKENL